MNNFLRGDLAPLNRWLSCARLLLELGHWIEWMWMWIQVQDRSRLQVQSSSCC